MFCILLQKQKGDHTLWRCSKRQKSSNCPATVIQDGDNFAIGLKAHTHQSEPGSLTAIKIKAEVKMIFIYYLALLTYLFAHIYFVKKSVVPICILCVVIDSSLQVHLFQLKLYFSFE